MTAMTPAAVLERYGPEVALYATLSSTLSTSKVQPEIAQRYIQQLIKNTVIMNDARRIPMSSDKRNIDRLTHTGRVLVAPGENTSPSSADAIGFSQTQLDVVEWVAAQDWTLTTIEDNIEGGTLETTITDVMSRLMARDLEEMSLYSDSDAVVDTEPWILTSADVTFFKIQTHDGFFLLSNNITDKAGAIPEKASDIFKELMDDIDANVLSNFPRSSWRLYVHDRVERWYRQEVGERSTNLGDQVLFNNAPVSYDGIPVVSVPGIKFEARTQGAGDLARTTDAMLVIPSNLIFGMRRDVTMDIEKKPRPRRWELTLTMRGDFQVENADYYSVQTNLRVPS